MIDSPWLLIPEAVKYSKVSRTELLEALHDETLRGHQTKPGGKWRIHKADLDAYVRGEGPVSAPQRITRTAS